MSTYKYLQIKDVQKDDVNAHIFNIYSDNTDKSNERDDAHKSEWKILHVNINNFDKVDKGGIIAPIHHSGNFCWTAGTNTQKSIFLRVIP